MATGMLKAIEEGRIFCGGGVAGASELPWHEHPVFTGVALKHLITGKDTGGKFSSHLVRVKGGCEIGEHVHAGKWELHEVVQGDGRCIIEGRQVDYRQGVAAVVPADIPHVVKAGDDDLYILAKFAPALL